MLCQRVDHIKKQHGFTLIELFVGMAIFGIIAAGIYATFANAIRFNREAQESDNFYRDARWAVDTLTSDLENMVAYHTPKDMQEVHKIIVREVMKENVPVFEENISDLFESESNPASFIGQQDSLSLILPSCDGLKEVRYYLEAPEDVAVYQVLVGRTSPMPSSMTTRKDERQKKNYFLMREERPFPYQEIQDMAPPFQTEIVSPNILEGGLKFSYADSAELSTGGQVAWTEEWKQPQMPWAVQVQITFVHPRNNRTWEIVKNIYIPIGHGPLATLP